MAEPSIGWSGAASVMLIAGLLLVLSGWAVIAISRRAADGRLGPNRYAGIRTRTTRSSPEAWRAAHEAGLDRTVLGARAMMATGVIAPLVAIGVSPDDPDGATGTWGVVLGVGVALATAILVSGALTGQRAARAVAAAAD